jgi:putative transposase
MELEWLKKNLSCSDAHELRKLVDQDHPELSISRQCVLLGLPRSTLSDDNLVEGSRQSG